MRITIEAENEAETKMLAEPFVREGCLRFGLSGITDRRSTENPTGEFGFLHGDGIGIRGDLARALASLDVQAMQQTSLNGVLQANNVIVDAQRNRALRQEIAAGRNGRDGLQIHRP